MKKIVAALVTILILSLSTVCVCYAGDVPEALLYTDGAQLYFGKVMESTDTALTVLPVKSVKGDIELNKTITYTKGFHGTKAQVGKTYLFGYVDENNLYYWTTDSMDPKTLKVNDQNGMNKRLQDYLNNGDYEKAETARLQKAKTNATPSSAPTVPPTPCLSATSTESQTSSPTTTTELSQPISAGASANLPSGLEPSYMLLIAALIVSAALALLVIMRRAHKR